MIDLRKLMSRF